MDIMDVMNNMSSYQYNQFAEMTGLPAEMYWPVTIGVAVAGIVLQTFLIVGSS